MNLLLNLLKWDLQSDFTLKSVFKVKSIFIILCKICEKFDFFLSGPFRLILVTYYHIIFCDLLLKFIALYNILMSGNSKDLKCVVRRRCRQWSVVLVN